MSSFFNFQLNLFIKKDGKIQKLYIFEHFKIYQMNILEINWIGVFLGALGGFVLGAIWYGPLFGKTWMKLLGITKEDGKNFNMGLLMGGSGLTYIVLSTIISLLIYSSPSCCMDGICWMQGAKIGGLIGLACTTTIFNNGLYELRPLRLMLINSTYCILNGALIGIIISLLD